MTVLKRFIGFSIWLYPLCFLSFNPFCIIMEKRAVNTWKLLLMILPSIRLNEEVLLSSNGKKTSSSIIRRTSVLTHHQRVRARVEDGVSQREKSRLCRRQRLRREFQVSGNAVARQATIGTACAMLCTARKNCSGALSSRGRREPTKAEAEALEAERTSADRHDSH